MVPFMISRTMVERVEWFSPIHYEILTFFQEHDIQISPRDLAVNIDYDRGYTGKECRTLAQAGLLQNQNGVYQLTDFGRAFLSGKVDSGEVQRPEESD